MLTIRLQRKGKKNQPFFKIIVIEEKKSSTKGRSVEELGFYNPLTKERSLNGDRAKYWMSVGAKPSDTVYNMLVTDNIIEGKKRPKHKKSKKKESETTPAASAPAAETSQEAPPPEPVKTEETVEKPKEAEATQEQSQETPKSQPEEPKKEEQTGS